ncbi:unnamed protein product [Strongylus vulgaris]|uniref:Uncharacterized protein n=1 Tax=Strongylus vulgaris TaxID=40348 RepID=A0A3P7IK67_STRVU|nr:unnamed protein product [Strongylus vulgaris]
MLMNLCNGVYQNSIYGVVADFPDNYPNSLIIVSPDSIMLNALLYFSISLGILIICGLSLIVLVKLPYYRYVTEIGERARRNDHAERPSVKQYLECLSYVSR